MPRIRKGAARRQAHKRVLKAAKGRRSSAGHLYRAAKESVVRAGVYARFGRKLRKRNFRELWITRLTAACQQRGIMYSRLVSGLKKANITLNRKMLSEIAIADPVAFDAIVAAAKPATI
ncbi:MAG: 50S ribosomal protein L20 [Sedimentisphaerales bacterium]|jgi:large subunit ribosomal protein L20